MPIRQLTPALLKKAQDEVGEVPARIPEDIRTIKEWLLKQPHMNANLDDQWILSFLRGCKFSLERTKEKLDNFYIGKTLAPEISMPTDPADESFRALFRLGGCVPLKQPVSEDGVVIIIYRPGVYDYKKCTMQQTMQLQYMINEIFLLENDNITIAGAKMLADLKNMALSDFMQMPPSLMVKMNMCGEKALPFRFKGAHHMNTPPGIETIFNMFSKFMSEKLKSRIYVHNQNFDELYKHIPRECLPTEYGGDAGPISDLIDYWEPKILAYREYFLECKKYKNDESKRPGKPMSIDSLYGIDGSFRSLNVD